MPLSREIWARKRIQKAFCETYIPAVFFCSSAIVKERCHILVHWKKIEGGGWQLFSLCLKFFILLTKTTVWPGAKVRSIHGFSWSNWAVGSDPRSLLSFPFMCISGVANGMRGILISYQQPSITCVVIQLQSNKNEGLYSVEYRERGGRPKVRLRSEDLRFNKNWIKSPIVCSLSSPLVGRLLLYGFPTDIDVKHKLLHFLL